MTAINLLAPRRVMERETRLRRNRWTMAMSAAVAVAGGAIAWAQGTRVQSHELRVEALRLEDEIERLAVVAEDQEKSLSEREVQVQVLRRVARQPDWSGVLDLLGSWCGTATRLETVTMRMESGRSRFVIVVVGVSESQEKVSAFVDEIARSGLFESIVLGGTRRVEGIGMLGTRFELTFELAGHRAQSEALR